MAKTVRVQFVDAQTFMKQLPQQSVPERVQVQLTTKGASGRFVPEEVATHDRDPRPYTMEAFVRCHDPPLTQLAAPPSLP